MRGLARGAFVAFIIQLLAAFVVYWVFDSPKFAGVAMVVAAVVSGFVVWGYILDDTTGLACAGAAVFILIAIASLVTSVPASADEIWKALRGTVFGLAVLSWLVPPLWLWREEQGGISLGKALAVTLPFGFGVLIRGYVWLLSAFRFRRRLRHV